jgi:hypothetical protein
MTIGRVDGAVTAGAETPAHPSAQTADNLGVAVTTTAHTPPTSIVIRRGRSFSARRTHENGGHEPVDTDVPRDCRRVRHSARVGVCRVGSFRRVPLSAPLP